MAWFECTTSASSGNGVALIVTTDAEFAGSNITASNGEDTFTQQCPSSAPYVVTFEDIPTGTYTISAVSGGQTVTKTYVVADYNFAFHNTPTGSTATPVNVIQTWLQCADIWDKNYTTINQVLADTSTLLALISSNNAADYMARSTNWASSVCANATAMTYIGNNNYCANKLLANSTWCNAICNSTYFESVLKVKVPTMTSNTAPSGIASGSSYYTGGFEYYKAFDGSYSGDNGWGATPNQSNQYVAYEFTSPVMVKKVVLHQRGLDLNLSTKQFHIDGYNGSSWITLSNTETMPSTTSGQKTVILNNNNTKYSKYRMFAIDSYGTLIGIGELQFYGRA